MINDPEYQYIKGWLMLYSVGLFISLLLLFAQGVEIIKVDDTSTIAYFLLGLSAYQLVLLTSMLYKKKWVIGGNIVMLGILIILQIILVMPSLTSNPDQAYQFGESLGSQIIYLMPEAVWLLYWVKSKRVQRTFTE